MRALKRIVTPTIALAVAACSFPIEEFQPGGGAQRGLTGDAASGGADAYDDGPSADAISEAGETDAAADDATALDADDASTDADTGCTCIAYNPGGKCKEWSSPGCP